MSVEEVLDAVAVAVGVEQGCAVILAIAGANQADISVGGDTRAEFASFGCIISGDLD